MALITRKPDYSDLDLNFIPHPTTKDVVIKTGADAIKRSIRNLILTNFYDRPFRSMIGSNVNRLLFENANPLTLGFLKDAILEVIRNYEPRVEVTSVNINENIDQNGFDVTIQFNIINRSQPTQINLFLERIR